MRERAGTMSSTTVGRRITALLAILATVTAIAPFLPGRVAKAAEMPGRATAATAPTAQAGTTSPAGAWMPSAPFYATFY